MKFVMSGSLRSEKTAVPVGIFNFENPFVEKVQKCLLPVGDYLPYYLNVEIGRLEITISENYHSDGKPMDRGDRPYVYWIKIRKDKPFVLDFINKPEIMFVLPARDQKFKRGDEVEVKALLTDPVLDVMIRRLSDTGRMEKITQTRPSGRSSTYERPKLLEPDVIITNSAGKEVSRDVLPFDGDGTCGYSWRIPKNLKLTGKEEAFTVTVVYDTLELYGKIKASRKIVITAD